MDPDEWTQIHDGAVLTEAGWHLVTAADSEAETLLRDLAATARRYVQTYHRDGDDRTWDCLVIISAHRPGDVISIVHLAAELTQVDVADIPCPQTPPHDEDGHLQARGSTAQFTAFDTVRAALCDRMRSRRGADPSPDAVQEWLDCAWTTMGHRRTQPTSM